MDLTLGASSSLHSEITPLHVTIVLRKQHVGHVTQPTRLIDGGGTTSISFASKTFRSVGDLSFQAIVDGKVINCFVIFEALPPCDCAHQKVTAEGVYYDHRDWIELTTPDPICTGSFALVIVYGRNLVASRASLPHGGVSTYDLDRARQLHLVPRLPR